MKRYLFVCLACIISLINISSNLWGLDDYPYLKIVRNSSLSITGQSFIRFLSSDPGIARIRKTDQNKFIIKGMAPGAAYIYLWNDNNLLTTIKIIVSKEPLADDANSNANLISPGNDGENLKFNYTGSYYNGTSISQYSSNLWSYSGSFNQLSFSGKTPFGSTNSALQYESNNGMSAVTYLRFDASNDNYYFNLGDNAAYFSDISLPSINYQGFYFKTSALKNTELVFAGGSRGNGYWGKNVRNDTRPVLPFLAAKATVKPMQPLELTLSAVSSSREGSSDQAAIASVAGKYYLLNSMSLAGEASFASYGRRAWMAGMEYFGQNLFLKGTYKHVPTDFQTPSDTATSRGIEGYFISGSLKPVPFLQMSGELNRYKNTYLQGNNNTLNGEVNADIRFILNPKVVFSFAPWSQDHSGFSSGGIGEGAITQFSYGFEFLGNDIIYGRYEPVKFRDTRTNEADYIEDKKVIGSRVSINEALSFNVENQWKMKTLTASNLIENSNSLNLIMNYDSKIGKTPFYTVFNSNYSVGSDSGGRFNQIYGDLEIGYKFKEDSKLYVRGKLADYRGFGGSNADRVENHINFGAQFPLESKLAFKGSGDIKGIVFKDSDEDGIYSSGEALIPHAQIIVNNKKYLTDNEGRYFIRGIKSGKVKIELDLNLAASGAILTVPNPQIINIESGQTKEIDFGLINKSKITGKVYKDSFVPLAGIKINYDNNSVLTDTDGSFIILDISEGAHVFQIDLNSMPKGLLPAFPIKQNITIKEGEAIVINLPFKSVSK